MPDLITVRKVSSEPDLQNVLLIRTKVFVNEQHCPPGLEYANEEESHHFLALCNEVACGAARWRQTENGIKMERFAVLPEYRRKGIGAALVRAVLSDIPFGAGNIYLNAQITAERFYAPFGFEPSGDQFEEAGIMHQKMILVSRN
jgi:predicted GNAT family N-acyltransferase